MANFNVYITYILILSVALAVLALIGWLLTKLRIPFKIIIIVLAVIFIIIALISIPIK